MQKEQKVMTQAEEIRELRRWLREDAEKSSDRVAALHEKIDAHAAENRKEHKILEAQIAGQDKLSSINKVKIASLATLVSLIVSALVMSGAGGFTG